MSYFPDGTVVNRPGVLAWLHARTDSLGQHATFTAARRHRTWRVFGWLDTGHPFAAGPCAPGLLSALELAAASPVDQSRGFHRCPFCPTAAAGLNGTVHESAAGHVFRLGSACLEIRDTHGTVWKAPDLVLHYIQSHGYAPPAELAPRAG